MFGFLKKNVYPVGVDISNDAVRVARLKEDRDGLVLVSAAGDECPSHIQPGSSDWQKWVIETLQLLAAKHKFINRDIIASIPAADVFIDHVKLHKSEGRNLDDVILSKVKQRLPFSPDQALVKYITAEDDNVVVIATEREKINRHLAIYEKANLKIKTLGVWPVALTNSYSRFFGRRQSDLKAIVMLIDLNSNITNVVICRHKNLLFARSIRIGVKQLQKSEDFSRLALELEACKKQFGSMYRKAVIERLVFISGAAVEREVYQKIAKKIHIAAHVGDCLSAVKVLNKGQMEVDRRNCQINWATAFGLSLS